MYIRVRYGDDETILCNPSCAVINLLHFIKTQTGHAQQPITLDLTDATGLVQELDVHRYDYATKYLSAPGTYVLVKKQPVNSGDAAENNNNSSSSDSPPEANANGHVTDDAHAQYEYVPLLNNWRELMPEYRLQRVATPGGPGTSEDGRKRLLGRKDLRSKADSPAGVKATTKSRQQVRDRVPSRRRMN